LAGGGGSTNKNGVIHHHDHGDSEEGAEYKGNRTAAQNNTFHNISPSKMERSIMKRYVAWTKNMSIGQGLWEMWTKKGVHRSKACHHTQLAFRIKEAL